MASCVVAFTDNFANQRQLRNELARCLEKPGLFIMFHGEKKSSSILTSQNGLFASSRELDHQRLIYAGIDRRKHCHTLDRGAYL